MNVNQLRWKRCAAIEGLRDPDIAAAWNRLNAARGDLPFLDARAILAALAEFGSGQEQLVCGSADGENAALFVVVPQGRMRWATFQPSQIPLGAWVARPELPLEALADRLMRGPLGLCLAMSVTQVDPLVAPRTADSSTRRTADYIETAWLDVKGSFDDYWSARGKNLRQNLRKQRNKLAAEGVALQMRVLRSPEDMSAALQRYGQMESAGWKAGGGTAIDAGNAQGRFYRRLLEEAAAAGEAVVYEYRFDDRTVAMNLCLLRRRQLVVLKTTYDESIKSLSPAFLLREDELRQFHAGSDIARIEYFGRVMEWHTKLTDHKRSLYHLTCYRWPWVKQLANRSRAAEPTTSGAVTATDEAAGG